MYGNAAHIQYSEVWEGVPGGQLSEDLLLKINPHISFFPMSYLAGSNTN